MTGVQGSLLASGKQQAGICFDPRTKVAALLVLMVLMMSGVYQTQLHYTPALIPLALLLATRRFRAAALYTALFGGCLCLTLVALPVVSGAMAHVIMIVSVLLLYFAPSVAMAYAVVSTTTVSEFMAAMERMRIPAQVTIPFAVMFRFFPTVLQEWNAVGDAMNMRGVRLGGTRAGAVLEYRLVPMMMCSVKIGEELSAAALSRGLGGPVRRTNVCRIGFHVQDVVVLLACVAALAVWAYVALGW